MRVSNRSGAGGHARRCIPNSCRDDAVTSLVADLNTRAYPQRCGSLLQMSAERESAAREVERADVAQLRARSLKRRDDVARVDADRLSSKIERRVWYLSLSGRAGDGSVWKTKRPLSTGLDREIRQDTPVMIGWSRDVWHHRTWRTSG